MPPNFSHPLKRFRNSFPQMLQCCLQIAHSWVLHQALLSAEWGCLFKLHSSLGLYIYNGLSVQGYKNRFLASVEDVSQGPSQFQSSLWNLLGSPLQLQLIFPLYLALLPPLLMGVVSEGIPFGYCYQEHKNLYLQNFPRGIQSVTMMIIEKRRKYR